MKFEKVEQEPQSSQRFLLLSMKMATRRVEGFVGLKAANGFSQLAGTRFDKKRSSQRPWRLERSGRLDLGSEC
jgi:hypothetical protein